MKEKVLGALKNIQNKDMETNAYFFPVKWLELVEHNDYIINDNLICVLKEDDGFRRLYYAAKSEKDLNGIDPLIKRNGDKPITADILGEAPQKSGGCEYLSKIGFKEYSVFERMSVAKDKGAVFEDKDIKIADTSMADTIYETILDEFDPLNSHFPNRDEIHKAVEKGEITYIGNRKEIHALAYFENTNRSTVTLRYILTLPGHRKKGYARRLINCKILEGGVIKYTLWVDSRNEPAKRLYHDLGFKSDGLKDVTLLL